MPGVCQGAEANGCAAAAHSDAELKTSDLLGAMIAATNVRVGIAGKVPFTSPQRILKGSLEAPAIRGNSNSWRLSAD